MSRLRAVAWALVLSASLGLDAAVACADVVLDWNIIALKTTAAAPFNPPLETRNLAIVQAAVFDAVNSITREFDAYGVKLRAAEGASPQAAAVAAAYTALVQLYPGQQSMLDAAYSSSLNFIPDGPGKESGVAVGRAVAGRILAMRASDGAAAAIAASYTPGNRPGDWNPTLPALLPALNPGWGLVRPFFLRDGSQFRPGPPPARGSKRYTRDFDELKDIGSSASATRSQNQTDVARLWVATAAQNWNPVARQAAIADGLTLSENARVFALLNLAGADAFIASWDAKFAYNQWRPVTAIRAAATDGNEDTDADPLWTPLLVTPPFPDYIAGHTTYAGAAQKVLEHVFGKHPAVAIALASVTAPGVVEMYASFKEMADGCVDARVWGGIHWRTSSVRGRTVGEEIGRYAVHRFLESRDGDDPRHTRQSR